MDRIHDRKVALAKYTGAGYFVVLSLFHFVCSVAGNNFRWMDLLVLVLACVPIVADKRWVYGVYGLVYAGAGFCTAVPVLVFGAAAGKSSVLIGMIDAGALLAGLLLIYSAIKRKQGEFHLM